MINYNNLIIDSLPGNTPKRKFESLKRLQDIETLLTKYSEFLEASGYTDSDWREEEPTAIKKFIGIHKMNEAIIDLETENYSRYIESTKHEFIEDEKLGEMNHLKEQEPER